MKIALESAKGLEYLHDKANPPVIYRDLKSSNILLDNDFNAKLSDFGLAKLGPIGDKTHVSSRVMGTYGYCAPEYQRTGQLTVKSDVYSFGVVLLELITGRRAIDTTRYTEEQNLVSWVSVHIYIYVFVMLSIESVNHKLFIWEWFELRNTYSNTMIFYRLSQKLKLLLGSVTDPPQTSEDWGLTTCIFSVILFYWKSYPLWLL